MVIENQGRCIVFTGPTCSEADVVSVLPHAIVRPPIAAGDLWELGLDVGDTILIIDGYYYQQRSVRHKELLALIDRGVTVVGASSLGALRAAELMSFGMIGVGEIFGWYLDGVIDGDDEVAVVHGPAERGYRGETLALVNVRATLNAAVSSGELTRADAERAVALIAEMPFARRRHSDVENVLVDVLEAKTGRRTAEILRDELIDQKRADAFAALDVVAKGGVTPEWSGVDRFANATQVAALASFLQWQVDETGIEVSDRFVPHRDVVALAQLFAQDYPMVHRARAVCSVLEDAQLEGFDVSDELLGELRSPRAWPLSAEVADRVGSMLLDVFLARGLVSSASELSVLDSWLSEVERERLSESDKLIEFCARLAAHQYPSLAPAQWLQSADTYERFAELAVFVEDFNQYVTDELPEFDPRNFDKSAVTRWCVERWSADGFSPMLDAAKDWDLTLSSRGFRSEDAWWQAVRELYPVAKLRGDQISIRVWPEE